MKKITKKINKGLLIVISLLFITIIPGCLLYSKTEKEIIEQPQSINTTESQESVKESEPEPVQQSQPELVQQSQPDPESNTPYPEANQKQEPGKNVDLSKVITTGLVNHASKQIALTFDAGWLYENTNAILNLLDQYNVKATFFVRGYWVKEHPDLASEIVKRGHSIENHSLTHGHMNTMTEAEIKNELRRTADIIRETTGYQPHLFRPPFGEYDNRMLRILSEEGYPYTILWTVDSHDWAKELNGVKITKDYLVNRVISKASDNGIILMHVGGYETVHALPEIITGLRSEGYELIKVSDMLK